ncbi:MAG: L-lactate permease [Chloroflexi bacterium]|nr:L-lactate permease [Chloroflexota bacterium]
MTGPELTILNWLLAASPLVVLAGAMLWLNRPAEQAGAAAFALAAALALLAFGAELGHVGIAAAKGANLAVFVLSIVWAAVFLYNILDRLGAIDAVGRHMAALSNDQLAQALIIGWGFSSTIQGVTGFGVPVAVSAPLLVMLGVPPVRAAAMSLVGHGWAVTFGSLGSSYYTIQLVTGIEETVIAPHMALLFLPVTIASGMLVAHIQGGMRAVWRSLPVVVVAGGVMGGTLYGLALAGAPQVASLGAGMLGTAVLVVLTRSPLLVGARRADTTPVVEAADGAGMPPALAFTPYFLVVALSFGAQVGPVKEAVSGLRLALDSPGFTTGQGFTVAPAGGYAAIGLLAHPAPLILIATAVSAAVYMVTKRWRGGLVSGALRFTFDQCAGTTLGVLAMVAMAVVMADTGMTVLLAQGIANVSGPFFPLASPFIGLLGSFMSGSNTNSNVMFGLLQVEAARALGIGSVTIASIQSIGGSVGSSMAPAKVVVGATVAGLGDEVRSIFRIVVPYVLALVLLAGIEALVIVRFLTWLER